MSIRTSPPAPFVTMPHSHYCEKARWALDRVGVAYVEEVHAPDVPELMREEVLRFTRNVSRPLRIANVR